MESSSATNSFPCPACGFLTFSGRPGSYDICRLCGWEDDDVQLAHPRLRGGANSQSLVEAQMEAIRRHPREKKSLDNYQRDPDWRPLTDAEADEREDIPRSGLDYFGAAGKGEATYYWRKPPQG
jgi:Cysteine-rich CPCC